VKKPWARVDLRHPAFGRFERQDHVKGSLMWRQTLPDTGVNAMSKMNPKYLIKKYFGHERSVLMKNFTLFSGLSREASAAAAAYRWTGLRRAWQFGPGS
jgi:hypothetical protein